NRIVTANRMLGSTLGDREEAIEVMALSEDPWLRACAAYAMGEMRLTRFAQTLDQWAEDGDPLLGATAVEARGKLRQDAAGDARCQLYRLERPGFDRVHRSQKIDAGPEADAGREPCPGAGADRRGKLRRIDGEEMRDVVAFDLREADSERPLTP